MWSLYKQRNGPADLRHPFPNAHYQIKARKAIKIEGYELDSHDFTTEHIFNFALTRYFVKLLANFMDDILTFGTLIFST